MRLAGALRAEGLSCDLDYAGRSARGQFKGADRAGARFAVVIGPDELARNACTLRDMASGEERLIPLENGAKDLLRALPS
jgi:histidyl-tRNA synthetase